MSEPPAVAGGLTKLTRTILLKSRIDKLKPSATADGSDLRQICGAAFAMNIKNYVKRKYQL